MSNISETVKKIWNDPVCSKVIAAIILFVFGYVFNLIKNVTYSSIDISMSFVAKVIVYVVIVILSIISTFGLLRLFQFFHKKVSSKMPIINKDTTMSLDETTSFFNRRIVKAFPQVRDVKWYTKSRDIDRCLSLLLAEPLKYSGNSGKGSICPIWWFRAGQAQSIESFRRIGLKKWLLNNDELKINKIAVYRTTGKYYSQFVYVETKGEKTTKLYGDTQETINDHIGYLSEEYAIVRFFKIFHKKITRTAYDDGATVICGKNISTSGSELRVRYLTNYNFIIAAQGSPYNTSECDELSSYYFNSILKNEKSADDFFAELISLPKRNQYR